MLAIIWLLWGEEGFCVLSPGAWFRGLLAHLPLPLSVAAVGPEAGAGCAGFVSLGFRHGFWLRVFRADGQLSPRGGGGQGGPGSSVRPHHTLGEHLLCAGSVLDAGSSELNKTQPLTSRGT